jgi:heme-degrading monooxygenase HmoA
MIATTPNPPYYAVIFSSIASVDNDGYGLMAERMGELVKQQPGYLGHESARNDIGITVSYWESLDAIKNWKSVSEHLVAQQMGKDKWYAAYKTRICLVERDYGFDTNLF